MNSGKKEAAIKNKEKKEKIEKESKTSRLNLCPKSEKDCQNCKIEECPEETT